MNCSGSTPAAKSSGASMSNWWTQRPSEFMKDATVSLAMPSPDGDRRIHRLLSLGAGGVSRVVGRIGCLEHRHSPKSGRSCSQPQSSASCWRSCVIAGSASTGCRGRGCGRSSCCCSGCRRSSATWPIARGPRGWRVRIVVAACRAIARPVSPADSEFPPPAAKGIEVFA